MIFSILTQVPSTTMSGRSPLAPLKKEGTVFFQSPPFSGGFRGSENP